MFNSIEFKISQSIRNSLYSLLSIMLLGSCDSKPKVVEAVQEAPVHEATQSNPTGENHYVVVEEIQQTSKYTYLKVKEAETSYWIAINKADVSAGDQLVYTGGLKMRAFQSTELNKVFDEVILVSNISRKGAGPSESGSELFNKLQGKESTGPTEPIKPVKGSVAISELLEHPQKFDGKVITVTGRCTKVNFQIMGRNWIHITDESSKKSDLTITTQDALELGKVGVFEGKISIDKDFGAGYQYKVIMEEAKLK